MAALVNAVPTLLKANPGLQLMTDIAVPRVSWRRYGIGAARCVASLVLMTAAESAKHAEVKAAHDTYCFYHIACRFRHAATFNPWTGLEKSSA